MGSEAAYLSIEVCSIERKRALLATQAQAERTRSQAGPAVSSTID
jgi:hypothetical protein